MPGRTSDGLTGRSSRKRGPRDDVNDDADVVEAQSSSSTLRTEKRKRVRLSDAVDVRGEDGTERDYTPSDDEADDGEAARPTPKTPPKSQYELMRDNNFEHLRHEVVDDQRATQRLRARTGLMGENAIAENGIIESVTCVNFMCHVRLHCELGPLLNFIVGENGSGKSAILTAITLCLGGKASSTNRGGSLKSFVKEGCERAILTVKIKNRGQDAYKHDIFGDSVIVERSFTKSGASGFKVKSAQGEVISTKKQEVDELVEYYALQVDNPLNILSQDNARQFLNASTKAQKYKFFIEGVQLQQLDNDYRLIAENLEQMVAKVPDQEEYVKYTRAQLDKAQRRAKELEGAQALREKGGTLRLQILWKQVEMEEDEVRKRAEALQQVEIALAQAQHTLEEQSRQIGALEEKIEKAQEGMERVQEDQKELGKELDMANEVYAKRYQEHQELLRQERSAHEALRDQERERKDLKQRIAKEEERLAATTGPEHAAALRRLEEAKDAVKSLENAIQENKGRMPELKANEEAAQQALAETDATLKGKRQEMSNIENAIRDLERGQGDVWSAYERNIPQLVKMIATDARFETKPIGPLGRHVRLLKPEWSAILEQTFGKNLNAFIVASKRDEKILHDMMQQLNIRNSPIIIRSSHSLNLTGKEPDPEYDTILRALEIDSQIVRDQLIINHGIEQVILVPDRVRAQQIMFEDAPPRNVEACLAFHDGKRGEGLRLGKNISTTPVRPNLHQKPRMKTPAETQVAIRKESLQHIRAEFQQVEAEHRRRQQDYQRCRAAVEQLDKDRKRLEGRLREAQKAQDKCEEDLDKFEGSDDRLRNYQERLAEVESQREHLGTQFGELSLRKEEKAAEVAEAKSKVDELSVMLKDLEARYKKYEEKKTSASGVRALTVAEKNNTVAKQAELAEAKRRYEEKVKRQELRAQERIASVVALQNGCEERVHPPEGVSYETLEKQYEDICALIERIKNKAGGNEQEIYAILAKATEEYKRAAAELEDTKAINRRMREALTFRLEKWRKFQRYISSQSRANFIYLLSERGFRGKLLLDHEAKSLDLVVEPDRTEKRAAGRSTKTLSGGEKSFASICLLLAIWEAMGSPLRCLDEFDVFMDNVNRAISTNMLITAARRSVNRQYIFITPNAIEGRTSLGRDVKIIRLTDPRQRTLADH
ncbi:hypothetical protein VTJ83DRAFT_2998 [Remersonia thermophila]|uniref:RecF/RecN/SMC N-terminal domain-containing protein n=1 Tax=Remersonia thermophila TaxID=72144 RepID=A0ABR4DCY4_9PEZI